MAVSQPNDIGASGESRLAVAAAAGVSARLLQRIRRRYAVLTETVQVGPLTFPFTRIKDPNRVLDEVAAEEDRLEKVKGQRVTEDQLHLPYWAELWDSAMGLGQHLVKGSGIRVQGSGKVGRTDASCDSSLNPEPRTPNLFHETLNPLRVLDLGCGMGLAGTVAGALGHRVLFADLESPALLFARLNSLPWAPRVRTRRTDWRKDHLGERFDLVLGADILYERKQWDFLEPFWREHLADRGAVLLGEPGRRTGELFVDWIRARGWSLTEFAEPVETRSRPIRLLQLTRPHT